MSAPPPADAADHAAAPHRHGPLTRVHPRMHNALTDLHTYMLALDAERQRLSDRVTELTKLVSQEGVVLIQRRNEITEELEALNATMIALRAHADPHGNQL